jgi:AAA+ ATPase superfamily predicted ATPase
MKFYNRISELAELERIRNLSFNDHSRMTVVTGRRRSGKTMLIMKSTKDMPTVYLFVSRKKETTLCTGYAQIIGKTLNVSVPDGYTSFAKLFERLMELGETRKFNLVIDEFQEFFNINETIFGDIQNYWDQYRHKTNVNLIISGSVYSLMQKIFQNSKEPLFGRADNIIKLSPFDIITLKNILSDYYPQYANDDLLALYTFTGGIPKYIELLCDGGKLSVKNMLAFMVRENSPFIEEGKNLLIEEFGKNYATYFSILSAVSGGKNTQAEIEQSIGDGSIGGHLKRLIEDYNILTRVRPILSKPKTTAVHYEIQDNFLQFWFNYFDRYRSLIEIKNFDILHEIVKNNYPTYSGLILERYFKQKFAESKQYMNIGSYWEAKGNQNQIDIVALCIEKQKAVAVEVKRQRKNYNANDFARKVEHLKEKVLPGYEIEQIGLSLDDM